MELTSFKKIHQIAGPAIIAGIAEPILSSTDAAIVGNIPINAKESLAAVGVVGAFLSMLIWVLGQTRSVISSIISQYLGAGKLKELGSLPAQAILINIGLSILVLGGTYFFAADIFKLLKAEGQILDYSLQYYTIRVWGFPFTLFVFAAFGIFRGLQNTFWPMVIAAIGALLNIVLDFVLVYGIEDYLPAMHIKGAAWASLIAQIIMAMLVTILLFKKTTISYKIGQTLHHEVPRLLAMSGNLFLRAISLNIALLSAVRVATGLGDTYIAAHAIAMNIWLFTAFFIDGYASAGNIYGGRLLGAKDYEQLKNLVFKVIKYGVGVGVILMILGGLLYNQIGLLFTQETEVLTAFYAMFFMVIVVQPFNSVAFVLDGVFKGM
ncbi:MATE family efflux transporter, partial [Aquimarina agarivorans]|uniref:MATE family efflux transporter n=1 Tax=Aquimarina agarivorans TaxID=980584 RepID=UPI000248E9A8